jgi:hypothetical protein
MKTFLYVILGLIGIGFIATCGDDTTSTDSETKDTLANSTENVTDLVSERDEYPENQDSVKAEVEKLKQNFDYQYDDIREIGWYTHKSQSGSKTWYRCCIIAHLRNDGYMYMEDQYYAEDWLFHESITVKVGDSIYHSLTVPTYDSSNKTENDGGKIWENISYTDADNDILKAIAEAGDEQVKIRFNGREYYSDKVLSPVDKKAIKETYQLSQTLKKLKSENL